MFTRAGMQFESHLGHDVFPRQRRFCFNVLTKLAVASSDELGRGLWPDRRGACSGVLGGGFRTLAGGPSACCGWGYGFLVPVRPGWSGVANTRSWFGVAGTT